MPGCAPLSVVAPCSDCPLECAWLPPAVPPPPYLSAWLPPAVPPAIISSSFPETPPLASTDVSVSCSAEGSTPLTWVWLHDAKELPLSSRVTYQTDGFDSVLTLSPSLESDRGVYQCVVYQPATGTWAAYDQFIDMTGKTSLIYQV